MAITVRMYGTIPFASEVQAHLRQRFKGDVRIQRGIVSDDEKSEAVSLSDLILCGFDPSLACTDRDLMYFIVRVLKNYGAWGYLPQIIVGAPNDAEAKDDLYRLGASCY